MNCITLVWAKGSVGLVVAMNEDEATQKLLQHCNDQEDFFALPTSILPWHQAKTAACAIDITFQSGFAELCVDTTPAINRFVSNYRDDIFVRSLTDFVDRFMKFFARRSKLPIPRDREYSSHKALDEIRFFTKIESTFEDFSKT